MKALIVVDVQKDFCPGGTLQVPNGDEVVPVINNLLKKFELVIFTKDWHPANHGSFASQYKDKELFEKIDLFGVEQILWPDHCVQQTPGAEFHTDLQIENCKGDFYIFKKGMDPKVDSYSGFWDNQKANSTGLQEFLDKRKISEVYVCGLAGDFCVMYTALDAAIYCGYDTFYIKDATRFIAEDPSETFQQLKDGGVKIVESWELPFVNLK